MRPPDDGPTVPVKLTPEDLHHVAQQFSDVAGEFEKLRDNLWNGLRPAAGWAGIDEQARKFGQQFTDAYQKLETGIERARNVLYDISEGIDLSASNHWLADQAAVPGATPGEPPWATAPPGPFLPRAVDPFPIVGNATDRYPPPFDAKIPAGDPSRLRVGARAFYDARDTIDAFTAALYQALYTMFAHNDSEDLRALDEFWQRVGGSSDQAILTALRDGCDALGRALDDFANWIVDTNNQIDDALHHLVDNVFKGILIGLALAALTEGLGAFFGLAESIGVGGELVLAIDGVLTAANVTGRLAAIGGAVGGVIGIMQVAIDNTPSPDLSPTDPQVVSDSQITSDAGNLGERVNTTSPEHYQELGYDPATKQFRPAEADAGVMIENERGIQLTRASKNDGVDWHGSDGKAYDLIGPVPREYFDNQWSAGRIQKVIGDHLRKADMVPIQVKGLSPDQIARIKDFIAPLGPNVFLIGE